MEPFCIFCWQFDMQFSYATLATWFYVGPPTKHFWPHPWAKVMIMKRIGEKEDILIIY